MKIAVLNYSVGEVDILDAPSELETSEEIELWLEVNRGYRIADIYYMADVKHLNVEFFGTSKIF